MVAPKTCIFFWTTLAPAYASQLYTGMQTKMRTEIKTDEPLTPLNGSVDDLVTTPAPAYASQLYTSMQTKSKMRTEIKTNEPPTPLNKSVDDAAVVSSALRPKPNTWGLTSLVSSRLQNMTSNVSEAAFSSKRKWPLDSVLKAWRKTRGKLKKSKNPSARNKLLAKYYKLGEKVKRMKKKCQQGKERFCGPRARKKKCRQGKKSFCSRRVRTRSAAPRKTMSRRERQDRALRRRAKRATETEIANCKGTRCRSS